MKSMEKMKRKIAGALAAAMAFTSAASPVLADTLVNGYVVEADGEDYKLLQIKEEAVNNGAASIPSEIGGKRVVSTGDLRLLEGVNATSLDIGANLASISTPALEGAKDLASITVSGNERFAMETPALYGMSRGNKAALVKYLSPTAKQDFRIPDGVSMVYNMDNSEFGTLDLNATRGMYFNALADTSVDTLIFSRALVDLSNPQSHDILAGANVKEFRPSTDSGFEAVSNGNVLLYGDRLIKVSSDATSDDMDNVVDRVRSISPFAFDSIKQYESLAPTFSDGVKRGTVFSFYNQDEGVFIVDGQIAFCYDMDKWFPESVSGDMVDYNEQIDANNANVIKALLFAGVPNDGLGIFEDVFGMSYQAAKDAGKMNNGDGALNEVSRAIYNALGSNASTITNLAEDDFFTRDKLDEYYSKLEGAAANYRSCIFAPESTNLFAKTIGENQYKTETTKIAVKDADGRNASDDYSYELTILTDGITANGTTDKKFKTNEDVFFIVNTDIDINDVEVELQYEAPALGYYYTDNDHQDLVVASKRKEIKNLGLSLNDTAFTISKQDAATSEELTGAELILKKDSENGRIVDQWTSSDVPHSILNIEDGSYSLSELSPPQGYKRAEPIQFRISNGVTDNGENKVVMFDERDAEKLKISKQTITSTDELPNAELTLVNTRTGWRTSWTSGTRPHLLDMPEDGPYTLTEVQAPDGYKKAESINFEIEGGKAYLMNGDETSEIVMKDSPVGKLVISKQDINTTEEIPGAVLILTNERTQAAITWTSGNEPHTIDMPEDGYYTLTELSPPGGYKTAESIRFNIDNRTVYIDNEEQDVVIMKDEPIGELVISKVDITNSQELPGAVLTLTNERTGVGMSWTSGNEPHVIPMPEDGLYTLTEVTAPNGYEVAESITFQIDNGKVYLGEGETNEIVMQDAPIGKLIISKQDITNSQELPGATLTLTNKETGEEISWVSGTQPHAIDMPQDGEYTLTEVTAPNGYDVAESIDFFIEQRQVYLNNDEMDAEGNQIIMYDQPSRGLTISKQDITNSQELPGAELTIINKETGEGITWTSGNEPHVIPMLNDGEYTLVEVTAPEGYRVAESIDFAIDMGTITINGELVNEIVMKDAPMGKLTISKQDFTTSEELPGATITLENKTTGATVEWTSGSEPHVIDNPDDGHYVLTELTAPDGYEVAESIEFDIEYGQVMVNGEEAGLIIMYDKPIIATPSEIKTLTVSKKVFATTKELPGAELELVNNTTGWKEKWTSTSTPHVIEEPEDGEYTLTEITAPKGYRKAESINFTYRDGKTYLDGQEVGQITMYDKPKSSVSGGSSGSSSGSSGHSSSGGNSSGGPGSSGQSSSPTDPGPAPANTPEQGGNPAPAPGTPEEPMPGEPLPGPGPAPGIEPAPGMEPVDPMPEKAERVMPKTGDEPYNIPAYVFVCGLLCAGAVAVIDKKKKLA